MPTLLRIDSSPLPGEFSFSRQLTEEFVQQWKRNTPNGRVISRDLATTDLKPIDAEWIAAAYTPKASLTAGQRELFATSDELLAELEAADEYVVGVSMHNFTIPGGLKLWIDQIVRVGRTFTYENNAPAGLLRGKRVTVLVASGGVYDQGSPRAVLNFVEPYLRHIFSFIGVKEVNFVYAGGTSRSRQGTDRETILQPAFASIRAQFKAAA